MAGRRRDVPAILLLPFLVYLPFLYYQGRFHFDTGPVRSLLIGLTTIGMMFVAIGLFFSAQTRNQIIAAIWTFVVLFLVVVTGLMLIANYAAERQAPWAEKDQFLAPPFGPSPGVWLRASSTFAI